MTTNTTQELEETIRKERFYVIILAAIQVTHVLDFVIMMPLGPKFIRVFSISPVGFSTLVSSYTFSAAIVGFLGALYADHFDRKKFLLFNFSGLILGTLICALSSNFNSLLIGRIIAGAFGGILNSSVFSIASDLIPFQRRGRAMGAIMSAFSISSVAGVPIGLWISNHFDWQGAFYFICLLSLSFWLAAFFVLPSIKMNHVPKSFIDNFKNLKRIIKHKKYLQAFGLTSILSFGVFTIVPFIATYLVKNLKMNEKDLPLVYLIGGLGTIVSARVIGILCDRIGSLKVFKAVTLISLIPIFLLTHLPIVPVWMILIVSSLFSMFSSGRFIPAMTLLSAVVTSKERGTFTSLENSSRQLSMGLSSQVAGFIIGTTATGSITHYNIVGYIGIFTSIIALSIASKVNHHLNSR